MINRGRNKKIMAQVADKPRDRTILKLFLDSGIWFSKITGLHVADLDLEQGTVRVMGKGGKERYSY